jgi:hypothetical protein
MREVAVHTAELVIYFCGLRQYNTRYTLTGFLPTIPFSLVLLNDSNLLELTISMISFVVSNSCSST